MLNPVLIFFTDIGPSRAYTVWCPDDINIFHNNNDDNDEDDDDDDDHHYRHHYYYYYCDDDYYDDDDEYDYEGPYNKTSFKKIGTYLFANVIVPLILIIGEIECNCNTPQL